MIWNSIIFMTIIDLAIIGLTIFAFITIQKQKPTLEKLNLQRGIQIVFLGLAIIALFYLLDLITMFVFPLFMPMKKAMTIMKHLHLNQKWLVSLFGIGFLVLGLTYLLKILLPSVGKLMDKLNLKEKEQKKTIIELSEALAEIKTLHGILPICSFCKKIRDDKGAWDIMETYISEHTEAKFSHGVCPDCEKEHYTDSVDSMKSKDVN